MANFRGGNMTANFESDRVDVSGRNGSGKSRLFDAFLWCLYGKDARDRKDYEIKTRNADGTTTPKVDTEVTIELSVDMSVVTLTRRMTEIWRKKRGEKVETFGGNETECEINGVPVKVGEYAAKVETIIGKDEIYKMISNPLYFCGQDWKLQRDTLIAIAGDTNLRAIAGRNEAYKIIADKVAAGETLDQQRARINATKIKSKSELKEIAPRIDQVVRMMPEHEDADKITADKAAAIMAVREAERAIANQRQTLQVSSDAWAAKRAELVRNVATANEALINAECDANAARDEAIANARNLRRQLATTAETAAQLAASARRAADAHKEQLAELSADVQQTEKRLTDTRAEWAKLNKETAPDDYVCPTCRQSMPAHLAADFRDQWQRKHDRELADIVARGKRQADTRASLLLAIADAETKAAQLDEKAAQLERDATAARDALDAATIPTIAPITPDNYDELKAAIDAANEALKAHDGANVHTDSTEASTAILEAARNELMAVEQRAEKRRQCERMAGEIKMLEQRARELAEIIAKIEQDEADINGLQLAAIDDLQTRVNALFAGTGLSFELFRRTIDGNAVECCMALINGAPFNVANAAGRVAAGLKIISVLNGAYNIAAPIFIDNAEGVQHIPDMEAQVITLSVADNDLQINNNN